VQVDGIAGGLQRQFYRTAIKFPFASVQASLRSSAAPRLAARPLRHQPRRHAQMSFHAITHSRITRSRAGFPAGWKIGGDQLPATKRTY